MNKVLEKKTEDKNMYPTLSVGQMPKDKPKKYCILEAGMIFNKLGNNILAKLPKI